MCDRFPQKTYYPLVNCEIDAKLGNDKCRVVLLQKEESKVLSGPCNPELLKSNTIQFSYKPDRDHILKVNATAPTARADASGHSMSGSVWYSCEIQSLARHGSTL